MLDKLPIGQPEPREKLKCENCGMRYNDKLNWESIDESGLCYYCNK